ncbi:hypothetical protein H0H93_003539 [Arthromyces matolae]|nr:hypothetical protein H0H93_003539 [Arthromyces matolae]
MPCDVPDLLRNSTTTAFLVFGELSSRREWRGMDSYFDALHNYQGDAVDIMAEDPEIQPEDNATIMFTSGTTGLPKGVLSTQRQFLSNIPNVMVGSMRAKLRRGEDYSLDDNDQTQKGMLVAVPLFHVTGTTSFTMMATATGMKVVLTSKWVVEDAVRLIRQENVRVAGGVPAMVADLTESSLAGHSLDGLLFGGSPAPDSLVPRARQAFPTAVMSQGYGLTETNSIAFAGEDYIARPTSTGRASPVNEIKIVHDGITMPSGSVGEVWFQARSQRYERLLDVTLWSKLEETKKVITPDGWLKTGDLGLLDEEGFLYIKDRCKDFSLKDIIIRGGENIDSVSVENALYRDPRISEAAAVGVPDERLGELVAAVVSVKPAHWGNVSEASLIGAAQKHTPRPEKSLKESFVRLRDDIGKPAAAMGQLGNLWSIYEGLFVA